MISFENDYNAGATPEIMERMLATNLEKTTGYGLDEYSESAKAKIRSRIGAENADIFFLVGGTQTNAIVISSILREYQGVIAAETGHVSVHEAGAIEYTGHKVLTLPEHEGKICAAELKQYLKDYYDDGNYTHMVFPGMVYISYPTEYGTLYSKAELTDIYQTCQEYQIPLYIDGARLGYGLMSRDADLTIEELAQLCDVFYIGGTKVGALFGEAVVFPKGDAPEHFFTSVKTHGGLLAKGRLLGLQFDTLFTDDLYFKISKNAIDRAEELKALFQEKGYQFHSVSPTNQQYFVVTNEKMKELSQKVAFSFWEKVDENHTAIRFVTSWATTQEDVEALRSIL